MFLLKYSIQSLKIMKKERKEVKKVNFSQHVLIVCKIDGYLKTTNGKNLILHYRCSIQKP